MEICKRSNRKENHYFLKCIIFKVKYQIKILFCVPLTYLEAFYGNKVDTVYLIQLFISKGETVSEKFGKDYLDALWFYITDWAGSWRRILRTASYNQNVYGAEFLELRCIRRWIDIFLLLSCTIKLQIFTLTVFATDLLHLWWKACSFFPDEQVTFWNLLIISSKCILSDYVCCVHRSGQNWVSSEQGRQTPWQQRQW